MKMNIPANRPSENVRIDPFLGIDTSSSPSQIDIHNSPDMVNFNIDERGALNKRTGYKRVFGSPLGKGAINGIFEYNNNGTIEIMVAHGTKIYRLQDIGG